MNRIRFGTSGWRGILGEDFTVDNLRVITQAIADHLRAKGTTGRGIVVGYDSRFMGEKFAREAVRVLAGAGIKSFICKRDTPTPVIAFEVLRRQAAGGINITASHNPCEYNGIKFSLETGGPALPETTRDIEARANAMLGEICYRELPLDQALRAGLVEEIDPREAYFKQIRCLIDFSAIAASGITIAVNPLYGTGRGYLDVLLKEAGVNVVDFNDHRDPCFGGLPPDPSQNHIGDFIGAIRNDPSIHLGLATDGDGDRYGVIDGDGTFIEPNCILPLLLDYLVRVKKKSGAVARSVATSHLVDAVAASHGIEVLETPVGFKFISDHISRERILIGGEESAGLAVRGHVPDKDGILACLLVAEMAAVEGKPLTELLEELHARVGAFYTRGENLRLTPEIENAFGSSRGTPPSELAEKKIDQIVTIDGVKFIFSDGTWVLFRKSGTEPVMRVYAEGRSEAELEHLLKSAEAFIRG